MLTSVTMQSQSQNPSGTKQKATESSNDTNQ
jgi:hypothetical protein